MAGPVREPSAWNQYRKDSLVQMLMRRGLSTSGTKTELVHRLKEYHGELDNEDTEPLEGGGEGE